MSQAAMEMRLSAHYTPGEIGIVQIYVSEKHVNV